jgi:hypothetical protein
MTLIIQKPTTSKLILAKDYVGIDDPDAAVYITAVEAADGEALETATKVAIHSFVKGCKNDGIWPAIKASCILAGARTLAGALVPLVGTAPTNVGPFVSGDYNRKTGLVGDGTSKSLNSNRAVNADPQNSRHLGIYISSAETGSVATYCGAATLNSGFMNFSVTPGNNLDVWGGSAAGSFIRTANSNLITGFVGASRPSSAVFSCRRSSATIELSSTSILATQTLGLPIFAYRTGGSTITENTNARLAFYSIGESLDLALLDARVTDLINAFAAAIP